MLLNWIPFFWLLFVGYYLSYCWWIRLLLVIYIQCVSFCGEMKHPSFFFNICISSINPVFWKWNELSISIISIEGFSTINNSFWATPISHRIHGAGIYANIWAILMINATIYSSIMDPSWVWGNWTHPASPFIRVHPDGYPPINVSAWKMSIYNDRSLFSRSLGNYGLV